MNPGDKVVYDSHGGDTMLNDRSGSLARILGPLDPGLYDEEEVGPMYHIVFESDGREVEAFEDELTLAL